MAIRASATEGVPYRLQVNDKTVGSESQPTVGNYRGGPPAIPSGLPSTIARSKEYSQS
jgi:hypothetical protein